MREQYRDFNMFYAQLCNLLKTPNEIKDNPVMLSKLSNLLKYWWNIGLYPEDRTSYLDISPKYKSLL